MFMYERDGKLCVVFKGNQPVENPDVIIEKVDDKVILHIGDTKVEGDATEETEGE